MIERTRINEVMLRQPSSFYGHELVFCARDMRRDEIGVVTGWKVERVRIGELLPQGAGLLVEEEGLQMLMEGLWRLGYRPRESRFQGEVQEALGRHIGQLEATQSRLLGMVERVVGGKGG